MIIIEPISAPRRELLTRTYGVQRYNSMHNVSQYVKALERKIRLTFLLCIYKDTFIFINLCALKSIFFKMSNTHTLSQQSTDSSQDLHPSIPDKSERRCLSLVPVVKSSLLHPAFPCISHFWFCPQTCRILTSIFSRALPRLQFINQLSFEDYFMSSHFQMVTFSFCRINHTEYWEYWMC